MKIKVKTMKKIMANTFTPVYDEIEDRIILVINYEDIYNRIDFMITRSFILKLLPTVEEFMIHHYWDNKEEVVEIVYDAQKDENDTLQQTNHEDLELFAKEKELLQEVNFTYIKDKELTTLTLSSKKTFAIASLNYTMLRQLFDTIKISIPNFSWGIAANF